MTEYATRFMREVGTRAWLRVYWGDTVWDGGKLVSGDCPSSYGLGNPGIHNAEVFLAETTAGCDEELGGKEGDYAEDRWPTKCDHCPALVPAITMVPCDCGRPGCTRAAPGSPHRQVFRRTLYQAQDGSNAIRAELEPGDMYWATWFECGARSGQCIHGWTNCDGRHLVVCVPDVGSRAHPWDTNGRASNCTLPADTLHRCWVVHGNPETEAVSVNKNGLTCGAGGGSIDTGRFHGVLTGGILRKC